MAHTYNPTLSANKDKVRFLARDNVTDNMVTSDEEIEFLLTTEGNIYLAAAMVADGLAHAIAGQNAAAGAVGPLKSKKVDDLELTYDTSRLSMTSKEYATLATSLRARGRMGVPYAGGISQADIDANKADADRPRPLIEIGMNRNPEASRDIHQGDDGRGDRWGG